MIHKFNLLGDNIVLDVYSGAVHVVDDCLYDMLDCPIKDGLPDITKMKAGYTREQIEEALLDIASLKEQGMLFSEDEYGTCIKNLNQESVVKALCLHVAHDCNLRCEYCFAGTGSFSGKRSLMDLETGKAAIDFVIKNSGKRKNIEIDFFGGEPLMNLDVVREITAYAKEQGERHGKNFRFTITTNGMLLDESTKDFINENMSNVVLSIDGRKNVNDRVRKSLNGESVYDAIVPRFIDLADSRGQDNYYVRGTFTAYNLDFAEDVMHLADLGFEQISVEPVVEKETFKSAIRPEHLPKLYEEYEKLARQYVERKKSDKPFSFFHFMVDLSQGPCVLKRLRGCGAGSEYLAVTPDGELYPCHQFVGHEEYLMGNVFDGKLDHKIKEEFERSNVYTKPACADCWAKFYCSGGCQANAYQFNGDITKPHEISCQLQRKRTECAIAVEVALKGNAKCVEKD